MCSRSWRLVPIASGPMTSCMPMPAGQREHGEAAVCRTSIRGNVWPLKLASHCAIRSFHLKEVKKLPEGVMESLTWDRGGEMAQHKRFTVHTDVQMYFCDPCSPWQRGSNENTNRLLRQHLPDGTDLYAYSQAELNAIARKLNTRPRKTLAFMTPINKLAESLR